MKHQLTSWTVLVYTMVLVVIWVFMATVVLNIAVQLSVEYEKRNIEISLANVIKTKWDLSMKYARDTNNTWSWFMDNVSCPNNITMSWTTLRTTSISTDIRYLWGSILCRWESAHNGNDLDFYFNSDYTDLQFAEYEWLQVTINSWSLTGNFTDSDTTFIDIITTGYLSIDWYDDDFDDDDYTIGSSWWLDYPDWYIDNDVESRLLLYWYILEWSWLYNVLWSNSKVNDYIASNPSNVNNAHVLPSIIGSSHLNLDIDGPFKAYLYRINKATYTQSNEIIVEDILEWVNQWAGIWYLQTDLSLASSTGSAYSFDFSASDYALFLENTWSGTVLYQITGENALSGSWVYLNPLNDTDPTILKHLWSHVFVDDDGKLIWDIVETYWFK